MEAIDMTEVFRDAPQGEWLALSNDETRVVAHAASFHDALERAHDLGEADPVMTKAPLPYALVL
jgi:hypothetical protein